MNAPRKGEFTGRHMVFTMVAGFGVVVAVNFYMASLAVGGFHGTVVDNSYVASQKFNGWIDEADAVAALGWSATAARGEDGHLIVTSTGVPEGAVVTAMARRPIGARDVVLLGFAPLGDGRFRSLEPLVEGRWTVRLKIAAQDNVWSGESALE